LLLDDDDDDTGNDLTSEGEVTVMDTVLVDDDGIGGAFFSIATPANDDGDDAINVTNNKAWEYRRLTDDNIHAIR
jgi:hypothetical protein